MRAKGFLLFVAIALLMAIAPRSALAVHNCNVGQTQHTKPDGINGNYSVAFYGLHAPPWNEYLGTMDVPAGQGPLCPAVGQQQTFQATLSITAYHPYPKKFGSRCFLNADTAAGPVQCSYSIGANGEVGGNCHAVLAPTGPAGAASCAPGTLNAAGQVVIDWNLFCFHDYNGKCSSNNASLRFGPRSTSTHPATHGDGVSFLDIPNGH